MIFIRTVALVLILHSQACVESAANFLSMATWTAPANAPYISFQSTLLVPPIPPLAWQALFGWPGLESSGNSYEGVMQPVLSFGNSCAPNPTNITTDFNTTWWISAIYANSSTRISGQSTHDACPGGPRMNVAVGDSLQMVMQAVAGTNNWTQTVTNLNNSQSVSFNWNYGGLPQTWAMLVFEYHGTTATPQPNFIFSDIVLTVNASSPSFCKQSLNSGTIPAYCTASVVKGNTCTTAQCAVGGSLPTAATKSEAKSTAYKARIAKTNPDRLAVVEHVAGRVKFVPRR